MPRAWLNSRELQAVLSSHYKCPPDHFRWCLLPAAAKVELQWWTQLSVVKKPLVPPLPSTTVSTDASWSSWGATWGHQTVSGFWKTGGSDHINVLELGAVFMAIKHWAPRLRGQVVSVQADNKTTVSYIMREGATRSPKLMSVTQDLRFADK